MRNTSKIIDITGQKFNYLTVIGIASRNPLYWECKCDCGNTTLVRPSNLKRGGVKSCGCAKKGHPKHNKSNTRLYRIYKKIIRRCCCADDAAYHNYGQRGITVCEEWKNNFMSFYNWAIENGYSDNLSIDRIDNNSNYEPSNCRWATAKEQGNNRRSNTKYTYNGKTQTLKLWCEEYNVNYKRVFARIKSGWDFESAITLGKNTRLSDYKKSTQQAV